MDHVKETADALDAAADRMTGAAEEVRRIAKRMRLSGDLTYAGEAVSVVAQLPAQCRLDLFVIRPLRAIPANVI